MDRIRTWSGFLSVVLALVVAITASYGIASAQPGPRQGNGAGQGAGSAPPGQSAGGAGFLSFGGADSIEHDAVANALGITPEDLYTARQNGESLASLAAAQGVDLQTILDTIMAVRHDEIEAAVAAGDLTQDQADWILAAQPMQLQADSSRPWGLGQAAGAGSRGVGLSLLDQAAQALGLSRADLLAALYSGKSIADLAAEQGVDVNQAIVQPLVSQHRAWLEGRSWRLTDAQQEDVLAQLADHIQSQLVTPGTALDFGMGLMPGPGTGPGPGMGPGRRFSAP